MIAEALDIAKETYFAILMDRDSGGPVLVGSPDGGMEIEQVAETNPSHIFKVNPAYSTEIPPPLSLSLPFLCSPSPVGVFLFNWHI